jgi:hypothetical protein
MKEDKWVGMQHVGRRQTQTQILVRNPKRKRTLEEGVDERIILK